MNFKRAISVSSLVGAVAIGATLITGPAAQAATAAPQDNSKCATATQIAVNWMRDAGLSVPDPATTENVYNNVEFYYLASPNGSLIHDQAGQIQSFMLTSCSS